MFSFFSRLVDAILASKSALAMYEETNPVEARRLMLIASSSTM